MKKTYKDGAQIVKSEHDETKNAKRVTMVETEMAMELNHQDGDSVYSHFPVLTASAIDVSSEDTEIMTLMCESVKRLRVDIDGAGSVDVLVSPELDGNFFYKVGVDAQLIDVCARRVKVVATSPVVGNVHLVGQG